MTNETAIKAMTKYMPKDNDSVSLVLREAMNMGIKALKQIPDLKEAYQKGYKDGQDALAFHLELCKEETEPCKRVSLQNRLPCEDCKKGQELKETTSSMESFNTLVKENKELKKELKSVKRELEQMKIQSNWEKYPDMMGK